MTETVELFGGLRISEEKYARHAGCPNCAFGIRHDSPAVDLALPSYLSRLMQWRAGTIQFCDCEAGQLARRGLERLAENQSAYDDSLRIDAAAARERRIAAMFANAQVPPRFRHLTFKSYVEIAGAERGRKPALDAVREFYRFGAIQTESGMKSGILLHGSTDMGKTGLLCPMFTHFVTRENKSGLWVQYNELLNALRDFDSGKVRERVEMAKSVDVLFIDDFGDPMAERSATDYARSVVYEIIDHRYGWHLPIFATSNLSPAQMAAQFHDRTMRRISDVCAVIAVDGSTMAELQRSRLRMAA